MKRQIALPLCLTFALAGCTHDMDAAEHDDRDSQEEPAPAAEPSVPDEAEQRDRELHEGPARAVVMSWPEAPESSRLTPLGARSTELSLANQTDGELRITLRARLDAGTSVSQVVPLGEIELGPRRRLLKPIDLDALAALAPHLPISGHPGLLRVTAEVHTGAGRPVQTQAPALYLAPERIAAQADAEPVDGSDEPAIITDRIVDWVPPTPILAGTPSAVAPAGDLPPGPPAMRTVCIKFDIQTADSAASGDTLKEDFYLDANAGVSAIARGVRINVSYGGSSVTNDVDTDPSTGCHTFSHAESGPFSVRVYSRATDSAGNMIRIHDSPSSFTSYPGATFSAVVNDVDIPAGGSSDVSVGSSTPRWTMMAVAAFSLYRYHDGISGKAIHIGEATTSGCSNSSWFGPNNESNGSLDDGRAYIQVKSGGACPADDRDLKFVVAHEIGHTVMRLYAGLKEGPWATNYPYAGGVTSCTNIGGYSLNSVEYGSLGFKEGTADFYSASVFNYLDTSGRYGFFGSEMDLNENDPHEAGGRLVNNCNISPSARQGLGIKGDWLRFWWDWATDQSCTAPGRIEVQQVFKRTLENHYGVGAGAGTPNAYTDTTAFGAVRTAAHQIFSGCAESEFDWYACWNGVDRQTGVASDVCY